MDTPEQRPTVAALISENAWLRESLALLLRHIAELESDAPLKRGAAPPPPSTASR
jgi:hypothetical protein